MHGGGGGDTAAAATPKIILNCESVWTGPGRIYFIYVLRHMFSFCRLREVVLGETLMLSRQLLPPENIFFIFFLSVLDLWESRVVR